MDPLFIVEQCYNNLPQNMKAKPWEVTEHGRKVLQTEDELNAYIAAYGEMHIVKCRAALQNFPYEDLDKFSYEIFDWGCGQGLATLTLLDMLQERKMLYGLKCIYLIEPSNYALNRATNWIKLNAGPGIKIIPLNKYIPQNINDDIQEIKCDSRISINLFSNILDIRTFNLAWLANKTATLANINYMICIGPKFTQNTNTRIADFCGYLNPSEYFSNIDSFPYSYTTKTHHAYGCVTRCFVHYRENKISANYQECAENENYSDVYDYASEVLHGIVDNKIIRFYNNLRLSCSASYDIFFRPLINCDTVDFALISKSKGIILINVCEDLNDLDMFFNRTKVVKDNLFNMHLKTMKIDSIMLPSVYYCVKTVLFFPNNTLNEIDEKLKNLNNQKNEEAYKKNGIRNNKNYYENLYKFTQETNLNDTLEKISASGFRYDYYDELIKLISSKWHSYKDGDLNFHLTDRQNEIVRNSSKRIRVKGVAGCGKTQIVANRAVEQHLRTGDRVLIITFNISLIQYIKMRIKQVPADFSPNMFEITNYHQFFKSKANLYATRSANQRIQLSDFDDVNFFTPYRDKIQKYKSIIIDEVQDFKESWLQSIILNFLSEDGSVSLFGDGEQNIYDRTQEIESKMPPIRNCGFSGRWQEADKGFGERDKSISMRIQNPQIALLSSNFAQVFMSSDASLNIQNIIPYEKNFIKYWKVDNKITADTLASNIRWIISEYQLKIEDVTILGQSINLLRDVEAAYVNTTNLRTTITFETADQFKEIIKQSSPILIRKDLEEIRRTNKTHFTTACNKIKMSTIHSFKGWESKTIILLLQPETQADGIYDGYMIQERENMPALVYTALTRAKCNLFIINLGNPQYHTFFTQNIH